MDSIQKVMKTIANEMVDIKGNLLEVSNRSFRPFVKTNMKIPFGSHIYTLKSQEVNEYEEEANGDEIQDTNIFLDINGIFYVEETQESLIAQTISKISCSTCGSSPSTTI
jgi:hypothetical protein